VPPLDLLGPRLGETRAGQQPGDVTSVSQMPAVPLAVLADVVWARISLPLRTAC
jgi:hypothetical protein